MQQRGGGVYGAGAHGETIDVGEIEGDASTLYAELVAAGGGAELVLYTEGKGKGNIAEVKATAQQAARVLRAVRGARNMIAKHFFAFSALLDTRTKFLKEVETNVKVRRAYGRDASRFTTLGDLDAGGGLRLLGLHVRRKAGETADYYAFGNRCGPTLGGYDWASASLEDVDAFVRQTLESLARLHASGLLHNDIHMENLIYCEGAKSAVRFKLIDWGASGEVAKMQHDEVAQSDIHTSSSPLAWFAMGTGPHSMTPALVKCAMPYKKLFLTSLRFQSFVYRAVMSGNRMVARLLRSKGLDEQAVRRSILKTMLPSFDMFNMGVAYASVACTCRDAGASERLMDLAERLTHYDDDARYLGYSASAALRHWTSAS